MPGRTFRLPALYNQQISVGVKSDLVTKYLKALKMTEQGKVFNDPIHGHVELHPLLVKIIDTPQFQRLRYIKQLGGACFVYPGATHTRFEHSIGVAYLAGELTKALKTRQPKLNITDTDVLCVQIAGLCHDLGHGPFSHAFDHFICQAEKKWWKHEEASVKMFDYLLEKNNLKTEMKNYGLDLPKDQNFIEEMIVAGVRDEKKPYEGRPEKSFLYEIVANKINGIDVDKFDYFARDCHYLGMQNNFDHRRFLMFARVCEVNGEKHICFRDKEVHNLYNIFYTRSSLHRRAYQHKVIKNIEIMITDALIKADSAGQKNKIKGSEVEPHWFPKTKDDMETYTKLTDQVFEKILYSSSDDLKEARKILQRILTRNLYQYLGQRKDKKPTKEEISEWKVNLAKDQGARGCLLPEDFEITGITIDYGMKDKNPMEKVYFYKKSDPDTGFDIPEEKVSMVLPKGFSEYFIVVFYKKPDKESVEIAKRNFEHWNNVERRPAAECQSGEPKSKTRKTI